MYRKWEYKNPKNSSGINEPTTFSSPTILHSSSYTSITRMRPFPSQFHLRDLAAITGVVCELKSNPHIREANEASEAWFKSIGAYHGKNLQRFLSHRFDLFAELSFPDADQQHLETCIDFFFWAFSFDDLSDEGELQAKPEEHEIGVKLCMSILCDPVPKRTGFPYARMLTHIWRELRQTATPGVCDRFTKSAIEWFNGQLQQGTNRKMGRMPTIEEFIPMRRATIGCGMVEAMIEYSLDIDLPEHVFEHPIIRAMSDATNDMMTWPNKEQADGDYQNLVFVVMEEKDLDLQDAIDHVISMLSDRVAEYQLLRKSLPSFGSNVDRELSRYLKALEHFVQGTVVWYYSPRYFRNIDISDRTELVIPVFEKSA
ncbi:terpenoid synthase [Dendrothele bispora CBS 962.96]|uniref:Terpene synthase n=1 Tax=Dendrothele bispora (strain CBS 962.96) TaxID=1314807 RepID=A0A4S8LBS6_DENBC|nr:terpenoid synthase [Dendrothele bispora CBS 962.96]THU90143.1 terpenoid synthase [Dendrothele bispora CBS 962.96]